MSEKTNISVNVTAPFLLQAVFLFVAHWQAVSAPWWVLWSPLLLAAVGFGMSLALLVPAAVIFGVAERLEARKW